MAFDGSRPIALARPAAADGARSHPRAALLLDQLRSVHAAMLDAAVGGRGLERVAELAADAAGGPVAVVAPRLGAALAPSGSGHAANLEGLCEWAALRARGLPSAVPSSVIHEVPIRSGQEALGVVALLCDDRPPNADAIEFLYLAAAAAVILLAIEDARAEMEHELRGSFLEGLRSQPDLASEDVIRRGARLGCDLSKGAIVLCADVTGGRPGLVLGQIAAEHPGALVERLDPVESKSQGARIYALLPAITGVDATKATLESARRLTERLRRDAFVGFSSFHADAAELPAAVREAELVLDVLHHAEAPIADEIGNATYKLLFRVLTSHSDEVQTFYNLTVEPMARYDDQYRTELVRTLQAYLDANGNMNATASAIFAHRHTVAYRLDRIRELTGLDPAVSEDRERLGLGLKVHRILGAAAVARSS